MVAETTKMEGAAASSSTRAHDESSIAGGKGGAVAAEAATVVEAVAAAGDAAIGGAREWARTIVDATALVVDEPTWDDEPKGTAVTTSSPDRTTGRRRAATTAAVDLTGNWTLIVDDDFASNYDNYLRQLGQPVIVRTVARSVIGSTREETMQSNDGRRLFIRGTNVRGSWERTLESSEWSEDAADDVDDNGGGTYGRDHVVQGHELKPMTTADGENVEVASWWEDDGLVHHSWVVGGRKYGGGDFENRRYLTDGGNILVCESTFHPRGEVGMEGGGGGGQGKQAREEACVTWRFLREGAIVRYFFWKFQVSLSIASSPPPSSHLLLFFPHAISISSNRPDPPPLSQSLSVWGCRGRFPEYFRRANEGREGSKEGSKEGAEVFGGIERDCRRKEDGRCININTLGGDCIAFER